MSSSSDPSTLPTDTLTVSATNSARNASNPVRKSSAERIIAHTRMEDADVQNEYIFGEILGEGSFGKVYKADHMTTGKTVAIKEIVKEKAGSSGLRQLEKEVSIFKKVDHKNIIKLLEVIESPKKMYLVMELCRGGDMAKLLKKRTHLSEEDTKVVMISLAEAIKYLHQQGIIHRDLKLENLLLAEEPDDSSPIQIKVSDFGLSTQQNNNNVENMQEQFCGTLSYMAPEMNSTYSYLVDVWAMGIIMYYLLTRYPRDNVLNESIAVNGPKFQEPQWIHVSSTAKALLREMLTVNPAYRPSSGEVLNHEWFTGKKREHGNVLELMKDFGREQKEHSLQQAENDTSAINGNNEQRSPEKLLPRKDSYGKRPSGDALTSTKLSTSRSSTIKVSQTSSSPRISKTSPTKSTSARAGPSSSGKGAVNNNSNGRQQTTTKSTTATKVKRK